MLRTLAIVCNQIVLSFGVVDRFFIIKAIQEWGRTLYSPWKRNGSSFTWIIQALELRSPLPNPIKNARRENRERNLTWRNSRGEKLQDIFWALPGVHFIHTICRFKAWKVRDPMLQTVCKLKLKWRSYGNWKTTVPSWKTISQVAKLQIQLAKFSQVKFQLEKSTCVIPDIYDRLC